MTVQKLAELADFYGVPVAELLPGGGPSGGVASRRRGWCSTSSGSSMVPAEKAGPLARYAATIQSQRGDYNGRVLSVRQEDLRTLAVIYDESPERARRAVHRLGRAQRRGPPRPPARLTRTAPRRLLSRCSLRRADPSLRSRGRWSERGYCS